MRTLPIDYPFPAQISPYAEGLDERSLAWAKELGLIGTTKAAERLLATQPGILVARACPEGSRAALQLLTDWISWGFLWDDQFDETQIGEAPDALAPALMRMERILSGAALEARDGAAERALADLRARILAARPEDVDWRDRLGRAVSANFDAFLWEAKNRSQRTIPSVAQYHRMRMHTSGAYTCLVFSELVEEIHLSRMVLEHPTVERLAFHTNTILSWCNDLFSLSKELEQGDVHNIVLVTQHERGCSLAEAKAHVVAEHDGHLAQFLLLQRELPSFGGEQDAELRRYVESMARWIRAQLDWSLEVRRYQAVRSAQDGASATDAEGRGAAPPALQRALQPEC